MKVAEFQWLTCEQLHESLLNTKYIHYRLHCLAEPLKNSLDLYSLSNKAEAQKRAG